MAAKKKNKSNKKPAVGSPAAGSNNNRAKNNSNNAKSKAAQNNNSHSKKQNQNSRHSAQENKDPNKYGRRPESKRKNISDRPKSQENIKNKKVKKNRKKLTFREFAKKYDIGKIAIALLLAVAIVAGIVYLIVSLFTSGVKVPDEIKNAEYKGRIESSSVAIETDISAEQQKTLSKSVSVKGNKSAFKFYTNKEIVMDDYSDPALIEFGSVSSNDCVLLAFLIDENGKLLYRSLGVEPGKKIGSVSLFDSVPYGKHKLTLIVNGYDPETYEKKGTQTTSVNLTIGAD